MKIKLSRCCFLLTITLIACQNAPKHSAGKQTETPQTEPAPAPGRSDQTTDQPSESPDYPPPDPPASTVPYCQTPNFSGCQQDATGHYIVNCQNNVMQVTTEKCAENEDCVTDSYGPFCDQQFSETMTDICDAHSDEIFCYNTENSSWGIICRNHKIVRGYYGSFDCRRIGQICQTKGKQLQCVNECNHGQVKCAEATLFTCGANNFWNKQGTPCHSPENGRAFCQANECAIECNPPYVLKEGLCIQPGDPPILNDNNLFTNSFDFITDLTANSYSTPFNYSCADYDISAIGRTEDSLISLNSSPQIIIAQNKNAKSAITVTMKNHTLGLEGVEFRAKAYKSATLNIRLNTDATNDITLPEAEELTPIFIFNDKNAYSFTITTSERVAIDDLRWATINPQKEKEDEEKENEEEEANDNR